MGFPSNASRRARRWRVFAVAALLSASLVTGADEIRLESTVAPADLPAPDLTLAEDDVLELSLDEAIDLALERNLALVVQRYDFAQAFEGIQLQKGIYDLDITGSFTESEQNTPSTSGLAGVDVVASDSRTFSFGLSQLTPFGGVGSFDWTNNRSATNDVSERFSPSYFASSSLSFTQPLLRGFGREITNRGIIQARRDAAISREAFELQIITTLQQVESAYWELVRARKQLEVSQQSLDLAQELHERNRIRVEVGTLAPFELVQSEAGIAQREGEIIRNQAAVGDAEDSLRRLLNVPDGSFWTSGIRPVTTAEVTNPSIDVQAAIQEALEHRPEVVQERLRLDRLRLDSKFFRNNKLPALDLSLGYGASGVDGRLFAVDPETGRTNRDVILRDGDLTDAIDELLERDSDGWNITLSVSYPLQNRQARAQSTIADLALEQGEAVLADLEQQISTEVRSAARLVDAAARQVDAAQASRRAQEKSLEAERKRFENGMSTSFQVLQIQEDLAEAQSAEVQAVTDYRRRLTDYYSAIGRLLDERGIEIQDPED